MKSCPFCNLQSSYYKHPYYCDKAPKYFRDLNNAEKKFELIKLAYPKLTKENLYYLYIKEEYSLPVLKREYGIGYNDTLFLLDKFGITKRTMQNCCTKSSIKRHIETSRKNYGVDNVSQSKIIQEKKRQTFLSHYGVDNIFKFDSFKSKINDILLLKYGVKRLTNTDQCKKTCLDKYGVKNVNQLESIKEKIRKTNLAKYGFESHLSSPIIMAKKRATCKERYGFEYASKNDKVRINLSRGQKESWDRLTDDQKQYRLEKIFKGVKNNSFRSKLEFRIENILSQWRNENGISFKTTYFIGKYSYDFLIDGQIIIEVQGDYWHANPFHYKSDDIIPYPNKKMTAKEVWAKDEIKKQKAIDKGFQIVYIWEHEMSEITDEELELLIIERVCKK